MKNLFFIIAVGLVIAWAIGLLALKSGNIIHILLVLSLIAVIVGVINRNK